MLCGGRIHMIVSRSTVRIGPDYLHYAVRFAGVAEIEDVAVLSDRLTGRGRRLVENMLDELPADVVTVFAFCRTANVGARAFYRKLEFVEAADVPNFYKDEDRGAVLLVRRIR